nr:13222_t:CDS:2 [Entrophospora candida]
MERTFRFYQVIYADLLTPRALAYWLTGEGHFHKSQAQQINHISIAPLAQAPADPATTPHLSAEQYVVTTLPQKLPPAQQADLDALPAENKALRAKIEQLEQSNKALAANVNTLAGWH